MPEILPPGKLATVQVTINKEWCARCGSDNTETGVCLDCDCDDVGIPFDMADPISKLAVEFQERLEILINYHLVKAAESREKKLL